MWTVLGHGSVGPNPQGSPSWKGRRDIAFTGGATRSAVGEREFGPRFRNRRVGNGRKTIEALKQLTTAGRQGSLACGELSFLFDIADALNIISGGEKRLNT